MNLSQITAKLSTKGWLTLGGSALATVVFFYLLFNMASAPSYSTLMAGVNPSQTSKITSALSTAGIAYQLQNGGTAVAVSSNEVAQARVALASQDLLNPTASGSDALASFGNSSNLAQSNFQQQVGYEAALEKQLDSTILGIQGVTGANVQVALPNPADQLFNSAQESPSASVLLSDSGTLTPSAVKGIADLVSGAIPGLSDQKVTITDQTGQLLWPSSSTGGGGLLAKQSVQASYDQQTANQVDAMLAATLGPGKAVVQVNADLNANQTSTESVAYANKGTPLTKTTSKETLTGASPSSPTPTTSTIPSYAATGSGNSKYLNTSSQTQYGVNKQVVQSTVAPGAINRQSVSVLVSSAVPKTELTAIKSAVSAAVGLKPGRDTISVQQLAFHTPTPVAAPAAGSSAKMLGYAKYGLIGLGAMLFLFFTTRALRKRETEAFAGTPRWLRELEHPRSLASVEATSELEPAEPHAKVKQLRSPVSVAKQQIDDLVQRDPDRVAAQVRAWMSED